MSNEEQDKDKQDSLSPGKVATDLSVSESVASTSSSAVPTSKDHSEGTEGDGDDSKNATSSETSKPSIQHPKSAESEETSSYPSLPYTEPQWSGPPSEAFSLTVIKNGTVIQEIPIGTKPYLVFGRLPICHVPLEHPSISRYHAILQYRPQSSETDTQDSSFVENVTLFSTNPKEAGFYIYDLGSTHGTCLNKTKVQPRCYYRVRIGQMIRLGGSSRMFVLEVNGSSVTFMSLITCSTSSSVW